MPYGFGASLTTFLVLVCLPEASAVRDYDEVKPAVRVKAVIIPKGTAQKLQTDNLKAVKSVNIENEDIVSLKKVISDPTIMVLTGLRVGVTKMTITTENDVMETLYVVVVEIEKKK